jgi:hypothetical protein
MVLVKIVSDEFVQSTDGFAQFGVEMVFDAVVGPRWGEQYLPGSFWEMADHLFPYYSWR